MIVIWIAIHSRWFDREPLAPNIEILFSRGPIISPNEEKKGCRSDVRNVIDRWSILSILELVGRGKTAIVVEPLQPTREVELAMMQKFPAGCSGHRRCIRGRARSIFMLG